MWLQFDVLWTKLKLFGTKPLPGTIHLKSHNEDFAVSVDQACSGNLFREIRLASWLEL